MLSPRFAPIAPVQQRPETSPFRALAQAIAVHGEALNLQHLVAEGVDRLPFPAHGATLARWRVLAEVAAHDLSLAKAFEGHTDALAILAELGGPSPAVGSRWATWCAEPPDARLEFREDGPHRLRLTGTKAWCSGAHAATHAVVSGWDAAGAPCLAAVALQQPGVRVTDTGWHAVGMAATRSVDVRFDEAAATPVGAAGDYTRRPGFWHGGAGIAACWWGGAAGIARQLHVLAGPRPDAHRQAHTGAIDVALAATAALLREVAGGIDADATADAFAPAQRARLAAEQCAQTVLQHAGRALGAAPLCRDARFARACADLPVFVRQSHAERDLAALGQHVLQQETASWAL